MSNAQDSDDPKGPYALIIANPNAGKVKKIITSLRDLCSDYSATLFCSKNPDESRRNLESINSKNPPKVIVSAGGDGTLCELIKQLASFNTKIPPIALMPFGTGNAHSPLVGKPDLEALLGTYIRAPNEQIPTIEVPLISIRYKLNGQDYFEDPVSFSFAGCGLDAKIIGDHEQSKNPSLPGPLNYAYSIISKTIPNQLKELFSPPPGNVTVTCGKDEIYSGPLAKTHAVYLGTIPYIGFGIPALPLLAKTDNSKKMQMRILHGQRARAIPHLIWNSLRIITGNFEESPYLKDVLLSQGQTVNVTYDSPVPLQIAGDYKGEVVGVEYALDGKTINLVNWNEIEQGQL